MTERTNEAAGQLAENDHMPRTVLRCTADGCDMVWIEVNGRHAPTIRRAIRWGWTGGAAWRQFAGCLCVDREQRCPDHPHDLNIPPEQPAHPNPEPPTGDGGREGVGRRG